MDSRKLSHIDHSEEKRLNDIFNSMEENSFYAQQRGERIYDNSR
jgi:hypothetical protein